MERKRFTFVSQALAEDTFSVVRFKGVEGISRLYEFDITLASEDPEIDLKEVLQNPVTFSILRDDQDRVIHGILAQFEQLHEANQYIFYRAVLVPRLWQADLYHENQLFLDKTVPDIIEEILKQAGLTTDDYELKLTRQYPKWEYICQYGETDFDFISRWMEREGIYYYFEQTDEGEKLIITDSSTAHQDIAGEKTLHYSPPSALIPTEAEVVKALICRQKMLPKKVILKDYNYRKPTLELKGEADVDSQGRGSVYLYGEHFKTPEDGNDLAKIRSEEILCREKVFHGESTAPAFCPGFIFELADHYRDSYNQGCLITEVEHEGSQAGVLLAGLEEEQAGQEAELVYSNRFVDIPADVQFRPERKTHKPRFYGTMNARVDAAADGQYAEIDDEGRYKVKLPFDQSSTEGGKASRFIRMAQPYAGADYGMHFPLHKGTEVLLTFVDGDPDRPIIAGSVPNPETMSPVTSENQTKCMIRTGGGNQIHTEDTDGGQLVKMYSPTANSSIRIGAPNPNGESGISLDTEDNMTVIAEGFQDVRIGQWRQFHVEGEEDKYVDQDRKLFIKGKEEITVDRDREKHVKGKEKITVDQDREKRVQGKEKNFLDNGQDTYVRNKRIMQVSSGGEDYKVYGNRLQEVHGNETYTITGDRTVNVGGNHKGLSAGLTEAMYTAQSRTLYYAEIIDIFFGIKLASNVSLTMEYNAGLRVEKKTTSVEDGNAAIDKVNSMSLKSAAVYLFT